MIKIKNIKYVFYCFLLLFYFPVNAYPQGWINDTQNTILIDNTYYTAQCNKSTGICDFFDKQGNQLFTNAGDMYVGLWDGIRALNYMQEDWVSSDDDWINKSDYSVSSYDLSTSESTATLVFHQGSSEITFDTTYTFDQNDAKVAVNGKINYLTTKNVLNEVIKTGVANDFMETPIDQFDLPTLVNDIQQDGMDTITGWSFSGNPALAAIATNTDPSYIKEGSGSVKLTLYDNGNTINDAVGIYKNFTTPKDYSNKHWLSLWFYPKNQMRFQIILYSGSGWSNWRSITTKWYPADETWKALQWDFSKYWSSQAGSFDPSAITKIQIYLYDNNSYFIGSPAMVYFDDIRFSENISGGEFYANTYVGGWGCSSGTWYVDSSAHAQGSGSLKWTNVNLDSSDRVCYQNTTQKYVNANPNLPTDISGGDALVFDAYSTCGCDVGMSIIDASIGDTISNYHIPANKWSTVQWLFKDQYLGIGGHVNPANIYEFDLRAHKKQGATDCTVRFDNFRLVRFNESNVLFDSESYQYNKSGRAVKYSPQMFKTGNNTYIYGSDFGALNIEKMNKNPGTKTLDAYIYNADMHSFNSLVNRYNIVGSTNVFYKEVIRNNGESSEGTIVYDFQASQPREVIKSRWPRNFKAAYTICDDDFYLNQSRAFYYGTSVITSPDYGHKGIVGHNLRTTKNLWGTDAYWNDPITLSFYDAMFNDGIEIALHTPGIYDDTRAVADIVFGRVTQRYGTRHWVDHSAPQNPEDFVNKGAFRIVNGAANDTDSGYYMLDLLTNYNFKYLWVINNGSIDNTTINSFYHNFTKGSLLPHRSRILDAEGGSLYQYGRTTGDSYSEFVSVAGNPVLIQKLIDEHGLAIVYTHDHIGYDNQSGGDYTLKNPVDNVFAFLEDRQDEGTLWVEKVSTILDWMLNSENVVITNRAGDFITVKNNNNSTVSGVTLRDLDNTISAAKIGTEYQIYVDGSYVVLPKLNALEEKTIELVPGSYQSGLPRVTGVPAHVNVDAATYNEQTDKISLALDYEEPCSPDFTACAPVSEPVSLSIENYQRPFLNAASTITSAGSTILDVTLAAAPQTFDSLNMAITPSSDSVTVAVEAWYTPYKKWSETCAPGAVSVIYKTGDLEAARSYHVKLNGETVDTLQPDGSGYIQFTYPCGAPGRIFEVVDTAVINFTTSVPETSTTTTTIAPTTTAPFTTITTTMLPDSDNDAISDAQDNCLSTPNGPALGTCMPGSDKAGSTCHSNADCVNGCSSNGTCSMNQEDTNQNGVGDVCEPSSTTTTVPPVTTTTTMPTTSTTTIPTTTTTVPPTTTTSIIPDSDKDGIPDSQDNCLSTPNGPLLGTCMPGSDKAGAACHSDADCVVGCSTNGICSMNQEDTNQNGIGDVCDQSSTTTTV